MTNINNNVYIVKLEWLADLIEAYSMSMAPMTPSICEYGDSTCFTSERGDRIMTIFYCNGGVFCSCDSVDQECLVDFKLYAALIQKIWPD